MTSVALRIVRPTPRSRFIGLGSVFGKALRDNARTALILGIVTGGLAASTALQVVTSFTTTASRLAFAAQLTALPVVFQGMLGEPIRIDTLGGFVSWRIFNFVPVLLGIWSVVVLSGTLAGELARGSLDVVASTPVARRRLAIEKVLAFLAALAVTVVLIETLTYAMINRMASLPGDSVSVAAIVGQGAWLFVTILAPGALAFAVAPLLGRGGALAVGAGTLFLSFVASAYAGIVPAFDALKSFSYLQMTVDQRPLAGRWDWPGVGLLALVTALVLLAGVLVFERRDLLAASAGRVRIPVIRPWVRGVFLRGFGERLPAALTWGIGLALYALLIVTSADEFVKQIARIPQIVDMIRRIFPSADILSTAGFLQLAFFQEGIVVIGLAAAVFVAGWASDEGDNRLEVLLAAPISRLTWGLRSGMSVFAAVGLTAFLMALGVAAGAAIQGDPIGNPMLGIGVLGLYGLALAGIGLAVGGLIRPSLAAPVTAVLGVAFFLLDLIGSILKLPAIVMDLALNRHLGSPMLGAFDSGGLIACAVVAGAGLLLSAFGLRRRDLGR